jgi:hypothetical protein
MAAGDVTTITLRSAIGENYQQALVELADGTSIPAMIQLNGDGAPMGGGGTMTNHSGTITAGATAQSLMPANDDRRYFLTQNPANATESLWIDFGVTAVRSQPSVELRAGEEKEYKGDYVPKEAVSVIATTTGHAFTAKEA